MVVIKVLKGNDDDNDDHDNDDDDDDAKIYREIEARKKEYKDENNLQSWS